MKARGVTEPLPHAPEPPTPLPRVVGWVMGALVVAYTAWVHQGLASPAGGMATEWWHPTGFLRDWESIGAMIGRPVRGVLALSLPAALGTGVVTYPPAPPWLERSPSAA